MKKFPNDPSIKQGYITAEDTTCAVYCECNSMANESLWVSDYEIVRCPYCGRGYRTEFVVWQFESDETDEKKNDTV